MNRYLPEDTEAIVTFNVKQLLGSPLFKKYALAQVKEGLNSLDQVKPILDDLGFDLFKDLDRITAASPGGNATDKGLLIIHGRFNLAKFKAKAEESAKDNGDVLKIQKVPDGKGGEFLLYEVSPAELPNPLFVALASDKTLLVSPGKDYIVDAIKRKDKPVLKSKDFQALLERMDNRQTFSLAVLGSVLAKAELPDQVKNILQKLEAIGGGFTIGEDINLELLGSAKTVKGAMSLKETLDTGLNQGLAVLSLLATQNKDLAPAVDIVKTIKCTAREKVVAIKATIPAEVIEKSIKKD